MRIWSRLKSQICGKTVAWVPPVCVCRVLFCSDSPGCAAQAAGAEGWQSHQASFQSCLTHFCSPGTVSAAVQAFGLPRPLYALRLNPMLCDCCCNITALTAAVPAAYACPLICVYLVRCSDVPDPRRPHSTSKMPYVLCAVQLRTFCPCLKQATQL